VDSRNCSGIQNSIHLHRIHGKAEMKPSKKTKVKSPSENCLHQLAERKREETTNIVKSRPFQRQVSLSLCYQNTPKSAYDLNTCSLYQQGLNIFLL